MTRLSITLFGVAPMSVNHYHFSWKIFMYVFGLAYIAKLLVCLWVQIYEKKLKQETQHKNTPTSQAKHTHTYTNHMPSTMHQLVKNARTTYIK